MSEKLRALREALTDWLDAIDNPTADGILDESELIRLEEAARAYLGRGPAPEPREPL